MVFFRVIKLKRNDRSNFNLLLCIWILIFNILFGSFCGFHTVMKLLSLKQHRLNQLLYYFTQNFNLNFHYTTTIARSLLLEALQALRHLKQLVSSAQQSIESWISLRPVLLLSKVSNEEPSELGGSTSPG